MEDTANINKSEDILIQKIYVRSSSRIRDVITTNVPTDILENVNGTEEMEDVREMKNVPISM